VFPNARLCKAMLGQLTDQARIIETGTVSIVSVAEITEGKFACN
jgi:hypothetical protein